VEFVVTETPSDSLALDQPSIVFAMLADHAEALNNKVYVHGGGWDRLGIGTVPATWPISFAIGILVPWNATNQENVAAVDILDADGNPTDFHTEVRFNVGRSPLLSQGETQRVMLAIPQVPVTFPKYGSYVLAVSLNEVESKRVTFAIVPTSGKPAG
jgi:hypothetical protein